MKRCENLWLQFVLRQINYNKAHFHKPTVKLLVLPQVNGVLLSGALWAPCFLRWLSRLNSLSSHTERISLIDPLISLLTSSLLTTANPGWHPTIWTSNRGPNGVKNKIKEEKQRTIHTHMYTHFTLILDAHASRLSEILPPVSPGSEGFDQDGLCLGLWPHQQVVFTLYFTFKAGPMFTSPRPASLSFSFFFEEGWKQKQAMKAKVFRKS